MFLPACAVLVIGVAFQWEGTQGEADGVPTRLDAVGRLGVNDGRSRDGGTLPSLWSTSLSSVIEAVAFQWEGTQPQRGLASETLRADQAPLVQLARHVAEGVTEPSPGGSSLDHSLPEHSASSPSSLDHVQDLQTAALAQLDARAHPGETIVPSPTVYAAQAGGSLTEAEMRAVLTLAGWPAELHDEALTIAYCESRYRPGAVGDGGKSLGLFQLNGMWFGYAGEDRSQWADPVVNARTAWATYQYDIGRGYVPWKQWSCRKVLP